MIREILQKVKSSLETNLSKDFKIKQITSNNSFYLEISNIPKGDILIKVRISDHYSDRRCANYSIGGDSQDSINFDLDDWESCVNFILRDCEE